MVGWIYKGPRGFIVRIPYVDLWSHMIPGPDPCGFTPISIFRIHWHVSLQPQSRLALPSRLPSPPVTAVGLRTASPPSAAVLTLRSCVSVTVRGRQTETCGVQGAPTEENPAGREVQRTGNSGWQLLQLWRSNILTITWHSWVRRREGYDPQI